MDRSTEGLVRALPTGGTLLAVSSRGGAVCVLIIVTFRTLAFPVILLLLGDVGLVSRAWAQTPPDSIVAPTQLPVDLDRIREGLAQPVTGKIFTDGRLRFFAETQEKIPSFKALTLGFDLLHGPVPGAGMTHEDFLTMVTPKYINSSGGIRAIETLEWGAVNYVAAWTIQRLYKELSEAKTAARKREIQQQIDRELAALKRGK